MHFWPTLEVACFSYGSIPHFGIFELFGAGRGGLGGAPPIYSREEPSKHRCNGVCRRTRAFGYLSQRYIFYTLASLDDSTFRSRRPGFAL